MKSEIARKLFCALHYDSFYYMYTITCDGNFVCRFNAKDDEEAKKLFSSFTMEKFRNKNLDFQVWC